MAARMVKFDSPACLALIFAFLRLSFEGSRWNNSKRVI
jgi:hypothetical protein